MFGFKILRMCYFNIIGDYESKYFFCISKSGKCSILGIDNFYMRVMSQDIELYTEGIQELFKVWEQENKMVKCL